MVVRSRLGPDPEHRLVFATGVGGLGGLGYRPGGGRDLFAPGGAGRVDDSDPGEGAGVDPIGVGVPGEELPRIGRLGRADREHGVTTHREEHRGGVTPARSAP